MFSRSASFLTTTVMKGGELVPKCIESHMNWTCQNQHRKAFHWPTFPLRGVPQNISSESGLCAEQRTLFENVLNLHLSLEGGNLR